MESIFMERWASVRSMPNSRAAALMPLSGRPPWGFGATCARNLFFVEPNPFGDMLGALERRQLRAMQVFRDLPLKRIGITSDDNYSGNLQPSELPRRFKAMQASNKFIAFGVAAHGDRRLEPDNLHRFSENAHRFLVERT